ncbi:hypothetical protein MOTC310_16605 [Methylobacterium oryzae]|uniref:Alcohol dehydrogenase-like N-terminal domain-containing protein n=2 Tax=Methylobacterium oryzae TaxID=334852 RepID=A0ABU7TQN2_9HYPH
MQAPRSRFVNPFMPVTLPHGFAGTVPPVEGDVTALAVEDRVTCRPTVPCAARAAGRPRNCQGRPVGGRYAGALADHVLPLRAEGRARPAIESAFPFDGGAEAHAPVKVGQRVGQCVLSMGGAVRGSR